MQTVLLINVLLFIIVLSHVHRYMFKVMIGPKSRLPILDVYITLVFKNYK